MIGKFKQMCMYILGNFWSLANLLTPLLYEQVKHLATIDNTTNNNLELLGHEVPEKYPSSIAICIRSVGS